MIHHDTCSINIPELLVTLVVPLECTSLEHPLAEVLVADNWFLF